MTKELVVLNPQLPAVIPIVPVDSSPVLPGLMATLQIPKGKSVLAVEKALAEKNILGLLLPKKNLQILPPPKESQEGPDINYDFSYFHLKGVSAKILKKIHMPDGTMTLLVHGIQRFEVEKPLQEEPFLSANVVYFEDLNTKDPEIEALARAVILQVRELSDSNPFFTEEMKLAMINTPTRGSLADLVAFAISLRGDEAQSFVETIDVKDRMLKVLISLKKEQDLANLQRKLSSEVDQRVNKIQREFFLREQMKSIKRELGVEEDDKTRETKSLKDKIAAAKLPPHALKTANEELHRLQLTPETSPEFNLIRNYLELMTALPWSKSSTDNLDLSRAKKILAEEHLGLEKVKERILEFLAVRSLKPGFHGSILCLVGPPGVGKTSLGKSIAKSLEREFFRFSLGGMRDEAEIKGHRKTYVGAMPGKILQGLKRAGTNNPVLVLDEIDKLGNSYQGDPASALLEVLDPEQNNSFLDHYLDVTFDLSKVFFIATANSVSTIPAALLDRMEIIELPGYTLEEKEEIAKKFVIPRSLEKHGVDKKHIQWKPGVIRKVIHDYAREPGVRSLQQCIDKIARRTARYLVEKKKKFPIALEEKDLDSWLGPKKFEHDAAEKHTKPGVVTGLAWTAMGGDILSIEAIALEGKGDLKLTGKMGETMQESATIALSFIKKYLSEHPKQKLKAVNGKEFLNAKDWFSKHDIHLHIPAGAVPKDGPSAGVTMASAILSLVTSRVAQEKTAMTGELSLIGKVLPVGGIKEKVLAAKRAGIRKIVMPKQNKKDLAEVAASHKKGLRFFFTSTVEDVFKHTLH